MATYRPMIELQHASHGYYVCLADELDRAMDKYLPASPDQLRAILADRVPEVDWSDMTVSSALIVLADWDAGR